MTSTTSAQQHDDGPPVSPASEQTQAAQALTKAQAPAAQASSTRKKRKRPWWQSPHMVPLWVAMVSAMVPASAGLYSYINGIAENELAQRKLDHEALIAQQQQAHQIQSFYFQLAVDRNSDPQLRARVLRFLELNDEYPHFQKWAKAELQDVKEVLHAQEERDKAIQELRGLQKQHTDSEQQRQTIAVQAAQLEDKVSVLQRSLVRKLPEKTAAAASATPEPGTSALICKPGTTQMEFRRSAAHAARCGKPGARAYKGITGLIYWSVSRKGSDVEMDTCLCDPLEP